MTLVEVVVAIAIAAMVSIGLYGSAIYTMRQAARNTEHLYALQILNSEAAKVRVARYDMLSAEGTEVPDDAFEKQFFSPRAIAGDPVNNSLTSFTVTYELKGYGRGMEADSKGGSGKHYILTQPDSSAAVTRNEYADHLLVITGGEGVNQVALVEMNHPTTVADGKKTVRVKIAKNFDGTGGDSFDLEPNATSLYSLDYGMYCDISVSWGDGNGYKTVTETVYVPAN